MPHRNAFMYALAVVLLGGVALAQSSFQPGSASNITQLAADPSPCSDSSIWYNFTTNQYKICPGGVAQVIGTGTGSGSVTTVSVVTANGVSGIVANPTTTPAITLTLGAITPSSIVNGGTDTSAGGSSSAEYNDCDDVSGSGTAQSCSISPAFSGTVGAGACITYSTTTANTGDLTVAVNGGTALHVRKWIGQTLTVLASGDIPANTEVWMCQDLLGPYWEANSIGGTYLVPGGAAGT